MNIAVIYTGEDRTICDTLSYFKKNVLLNNNVHVFSVIQTNNIDSIQKLIKLHMGDNLKSCEWFNKNDSVLNSIMYKLVTNMDIDNKTKDYLLNSGSIIEYYQLWLGYIAMTGKENKEKFKYDYVIRYRTDIVINKAIDFTWLDMTADEIKRRMDIIYTITNNKDVEKNVIYFMNSLIDFDRMDNIIASSDCIVNNNSLDIQNLMNDNNKKFINNLKKYIKSGRYIITLRKNLFYMIRRDLFSIIPTLGICYGTYKDDGDYWWNAESQFQKLLTEQNITIFNSTTDIEDKSLYAYEKNNYYDSDNCLKLNSDFFVFIKRI